MNNDELCCCGHTYEVHFGLNCSRQGCSCERFIWIDAGADLLEEIELAERHIRILVEILKGKRRSDRREIEAIDEHGIQRAATIRKAKGL